MRMPHIQIATWVPRALSVVAVPALAVTALIITAVDEQSTVQTTEAAAPVESPPPAARKAPATTTTSVPTTTTSVPTTTTGADEIGGATDDMASATGGPEAGSNPETVVASPTTKAPAASRPMPPAAAAPTTAPPPPPTSAPLATPPPTPSNNCVVRLHGKGGSGSATATNNGITEIRPTGNGSGWGGRQWSYATPGDYAAALGILSGAVNSEGCNRVVLIGFSNGASMAAKVFCQGQTFGGRLARVIVDDPVTDQAVNGCHPAGGVGIALYWTGALQGVAQPGWNCGEQDWTCEGGATIGIDAYAAALGTSAKTSPNSGSHSAYSYPPDIHQF